MNIKSAYLEITNQCNLNCKTCYNRSGLNRETKELSLSQIKDAVARLERLGCKQFRFAGGEPCLHSAFDDLLSWMETRPDLSFGIVTNATVLNTQLVSLYQRKENVSLQISLDGSSEEMNAKTRGSGNFAKTNMFLEAIRHPSKRALVKMVISKNNIDDVADFYSYALKAGGIPEFSFINKMGNGTQSWDDKALSGKEKFQALKLVDKLNTQYAEEAFLPECSYGCPMDLQDNPFSFLVKVNGDIQPCQLLYDERFTLANILDFDPGQLQDNLKKVSCLVAERAQSMQEGCDKCLLQSGCKRGCLASAFNISKDPLGPDEECDFRVQQFIHYNLKKANII